MVFVSIIQNYCSSLNVKTTQPRIEESYSIQSMNVLVCALGSADQAEGKFVEANSHLPYLSHTHALRTGEPVAERYKLCSDLYRLCSCPQMCVCRASWQCPNSSPENGGNVILPIASSQGRQITYQNTLPPACTLLKATLHHPSPPGCP